VQPQRPRIDAEPGTPEFVRLYNEAVSSHRKRSTETFSSLISLKDLHFHDLRGTAVTRLALSNCSVPEIAAISGHSS
jgi:integrase